MVTVSRFEGGPQVLSAGVRRTIQSIKEVVGSHSDADIYVALKEANMDPNETAQKLLIQDPFHEVKKKRDRKKENSGNKSFVAADGWRNPDIAHVPLQYPAHFDRNAQRVVSGEPVVLDVAASQEFRVVRDNRVNQNAMADLRPAQRLGTKSDSLMSVVYKKSNSSQTSGRRKPQTSQQSSAAPDSRPKISDDCENKEMIENHAIPNSSSLSQKMSNGPQHSTSISAVGVYESCSDPVHVPSRHSKLISNAGAVRRGAGVMGHCNQLGDNSSKHHQSNSSSYTARCDDHSLAPSRSLNVRPGNERSSKNVICESGIPARTSNRSSNYHYARSHQPLGHQKASQPNMEWKPKSAIKPNVGTPEVSGSLEKAALVKNLEELKKEATELQADASQFSLSEKQNVIIAPHIQVSETERFQLTFGSLDVGSVSVNSVSAATEDANKLPSEPAKSASLSPPESSEDGPTFSQNLDTEDEPAHSPEFGSTDSANVSDLQFIGQKESPGPKNLNNYADVELVQNSHPPYMPQSLHREENDLPRSSAYDPRILYDSYFRPIVGDAVRVHGLPPTQEVLSSHAASVIPSSSIAMVHQQQQLAQMYPQLVSPFGNLMPYRQFLSPVYGPPIPVPGYSNNPNYNHLSNGSSFMLMPGNDTHITPNGAVKYGVQQFKPANPNGFPNFTNPTGYAINANGVVGSATTHDDPSRLHYKDNLYAPNPQAGTSEIWMNTRDQHQHHHHHHHPGLQSASYYSMAPGQTPHPAYLTSHSSHTSFNTAAAAIGQSSHMQFPAIYHPTQQQAAGIQSQQLGPAINVAGAPLPGAQPYQQTHLNWPGNF